VLGLAECVLTETNSLSQRLFGLTYGGSLSNRFSQNYRWDSARAFLDPWKTAYNFAVQERTDPAGHGILTISMWSCGEDGKDNRRRGDDIVGLSIDLPVEFDMEK
jgi:hypothetical protein